MSLKMGSYWALAEWMFSVAIRIKSFLMQEDTPKTWLGVSWIVPQSWGSSSLQYESLSLLSRNLTTYCIYVIYIKALYTHIHTQSFVFFYVLEGDLSGISLSALAIFSLWHVNPVYFVDNLFKVNRVLPVTCSCDAVSSQKPPSLENHSVFPDVEWL